MILSIDFLTLLVYAALIVASVSPIVLLGLLIRDWIKDKIW